jgi:hypothetical protein
MSHSKVVVTGAGMVAGYAARQLVGLALKTGSDLAEVLHSGEVDLPQFL